MSDETSEVLAGGHGMTGQHPVTLDVQRAEGGLRYYLHRPAEFGSRRGVWTARVDREELDTMLCGIDIAVLAANTGRDDDSAEADLRKFGRGLYNALLPRGDPELTSLRDALRESTGALQISDEQSRVQWELLYDEETQDFLGLSRDVARRLKTHDSPLSADVQPDCVRCLLIADPGGDEPGLSLPDAAAEALQLRAWFESKGVHCDVLQGDDATYGRVVNHLLGEPYHVIHYAGHIERHRDTRRFALRLKDGLLPADRIGNQLRGSPLVFLNGCSSAAGDGSMVEGVEAMTDAILAAGARVVVGSIYPVPDVGARRFAECFYEELLRGAAYGAAMRAARRLLSQQPGCRASWAGFVLYGNPCQSLVVAEVAPTGALAAVLEEAGMHDAGIDAGAGAVLAQACELTRPGGKVGTPHLLAALVAGADTTLRDGLTARGLPPDKLRDAFRSTFDPGSGPPAGRDIVAVSPNVMTIIGAAARAAGAASRAVCELDLQVGFVACPEGVAQRILAEHGVDVPGLLDPVTALVPETRSAIEIAEAIAVHAGHAIVGSPQLLQGLLAAAPSPIVDGLARCGLRPDLLDDLRASAAQLRPLAAQPTDIRYTSNVQQILLLAGAEAAAGEHATVSDERLFEAFVEQGGGHTGAMLYERGLPLAVLTATLFSERAELCLERFDATARAALADAVDCARRKRVDRLEERHLLYGLLTADDSLAAAIRAQDQDPVYLADKLFIELPSSTATHGHTSVLRLGHMQLVLVLALCHADRWRRDDQAELVGEPHVVRGLLSDGGGRAGQFLADNAIRRRDLPL